MAVRFTTAKAQRAVLLDPELKLGEAYMDGTFVVEQGSIADVLAILLRQDRIAAPNWAWPPRLVRYLFRRLQQFNLRSRARHNVAHHYDLDGRLYSLFLDGDQQYSCAYFEIARRSRSTMPNSPRSATLRPSCGSSPAPRCSTSAAAGAALRSISPRLPARTSPASRCRRNSTSARRTERWSAAERKDATFRLVDYRDVEGRFDRIVSVGMFEHVGVGFYDTFFSKCAQLLADDGVVLLHTIGRSEAARASPIRGSPNTSFPAATSRRYRKCCRAIERAHLIVTDVEILQLHYAETLKAWRERFLAHREEAVRIYDQRFVRMWEFYLACSEMAFREGDMVVFQIQMTKRKGVTPATRDYIAREEARLRALEAGYAAPLRLAGE